MRAHCPDSPGLCECGPGACPAAAAPALPRMPGQRVKDVITESLGAARDLAARGQPGELEAARARVRELETLLGGSGDLEKLCAERGSQLAAHALTIQRLERELKDEKGSADMYGNAWQRELVAAGVTLRKRHHIDAMVVGTRDLANARTLARQEAEGFRMQATASEAELERVRALVVTVNNRVRELAGRGIVARLVAWWRGEA